MSVNKDNSINEIYQLKYLSQRYRQYYTYIEPFVSNPLIRSYFSLVMSLILITLLVVFALSPTINVILGLRKQIEDQKIILTALDAKISALIAAQDSYTKAEPYISFLDQALPTSAKPQMIIASLHKVASSSGVTSLTFQISGTPLSKDLPLKETPIGVPGVGVSLSSSGSKEQVRQFLGGVEQQLRYIRMDNLTVTPPGEKGSNYSAEAAGQAYFYY